ncbi:hypothetical protein C8R45DRAFT_1221140 [Mycena sanguinolenta]|nr:hypothetical protein C8R45DRAFT_1221140 [Mycena sanguinolenta]
MEQMEEEMAGTGQTRRKRGRGRRRGGWSGRSEEEVETRQDAYGGDAARCGRYTREVILEYPATPVEDPLPKRRPFPAVTYAYPSRTVPRVAEPPDRPHRDLDVNGYIVSPRLIFLKPVQRPYTPDSESPVRRRAHPSCTTRPTPRALRRSHPCHPRHRSPRHRIRPHPSKTLALQPRSISGGAVVFASDQHIRGSRRLFEYHRASHSFPPVRAPAAFRADHGGAFPFTIPLAGTGARILILGADDVWICTSVDVATGNRDLASCTITTSSNTAVPSPPPAAVPAPPPVRAPGPAPTPAPPPCAPSPRPAVPSPSRVVPSCAQVHGTRLRCVPTSAALATHDPRSGVASASHSGKRGKHTHRLIDLPPLCIQIHVALLAAAPQQRAFVLS